MENPDRKKLELLRKEVNKVARNGRFGASLRLIKIKGTTYFFPELPPRPDKE